MVSCIFRSVGLRIELTAGDTKIKIEEDGTSTLKKYHESELELLPLHLRLGLSDRGRRIEFLTQPRN